MTLCVIHTCAYAQLGCDIDESLLQCFRGLLASGVHSHFLSQDLVQLQNSKFQNYHTERESYMYEILNLDEIKNKLRDTKLLQYRCANDELISLNKFFPQFTHEFYNQFCDQSIFNTSNVQRLQFKNFTPATKRDLGDGIRIEPCFLRRVIQSGEVACLFPSSSYRRKSSDTIATKRLIVPKVIKDYM